MDDAVVDDLAQELMDLWAPEASIVTRACAPHLMVLSAVAAQEAHGDLREMDDVEVDGLGGDEFHRPWFQALTLGHDWAATRTRTPLHLEPDLVEAICARMLPIFDDPDGAVAHGEFAADVLRSLSAAWQASMTADEIAAVLGDRTAALERLDPGEADPAELAGWFDIGAAHAQLQRIVMARALVDNLPFAGASLDPLIWIAILAPDLMDADAYRADM